LVAGGTTAVLLGFLGWCLYLVAPPGATVSPHLAVAAPSAAPPRPRPLSAAPQVTLAPADEPLWMTPSELRARLRDELDIEGAPRLGPYAGRLVAWSGTVISAAQLDGHLKVDLTDSDGLRLTGFCAEVIEPEPGAPVTIRGRLASAIPDGFVVERCDLQ
jgi:hypothetical protein